MSPGTTPATVFVDADNTLWDTDQVFAAAQLDMLARTEAALAITTTTPDRLAFVRASDQALATRHHAGLRYPPRLLVRALAIALQAHTSEEAARFALSGHKSSMLASESEIAIEHAFLEALQHLPTLRDGVFEGLTQLQRADATTLIVSESPRAQLLATAEALGLAGHFTRVIEGRKSSEFYRRVLRLTGVPNKAYMIGDQLDRDIAPAKEAGLTTIYFPGGFMPRWTPDEINIGPDFRVSNFAQAANIILSGQETNKARLIRT